MRTLPSTLTVYYDKEKAVEVWQSKANTHFLFAYEEPYDDPEKGTYYAYLVLTLMEYIRLNQHPNIPRRWHEAIHARLPAKLYADIEFDEAGITFETGEERRRDIQGQIQTRLKTHFGVENPPEPLILDATLPTKYSVHLIYPIWFESPEHVRKFMDGMEGVDMHYPTGESIIWMRCAYSHKWNKQNPLLVRGSTDVQHATFDLHVFAPTVITIWREKDQDAPYGSLFPKGEDLFSVDLSSSDTGERGKQLGVVKGYTPTHTHAKRIIEYIIRTKSPKKKRPTFKEKCLTVYDNGSWEYHLWSVLFCTNKNRTHRSNTMYIGSRDSRRVWYRCLDPECRSTIYFEEDFTDIAYQIAPPTQEMLSTAAVYLFQ
jgi:hypothetical protein